MLAKAVSVFAALTIMTVPMPAFAGEPADAVLQPTAVGEMQTQDQEQASLTEAPATDAVVASPAADGADVPDELEIESETSAVIPSVADAPSTAATEADSLEVNPSPDAVASADPDAPDALASEDSSGATYTTLADDETTNVVVMLSDFLVYSHEGANFTVTLLANGEPATPDITATPTQTVFVGINATKYINFNDLPKAKDGNDIEYTVSISGYDTEKCKIDYYYDPDWFKDALFCKARLTNSDKYKSIKVENTWDTNPDVTEDAPELDPYVSIDLELMANGQPTGITAKLTRDNYWMTKFSPLPIYDDNGKTIKYTVVETAINGTDRQFYPEYHYMEGNPPNQYFNETDTQLTIITVEPREFHDYQVDKHWQDFALSIYAPRPPMGPDGNPLMPRTDGADSGVAASDESADTGSDVAAGGAASAATVAGNSTRKSPIKPDMPQVTSEVEVTLYANGEAVETIPLRFQYYTGRFQRVPARDSDGNLITYTVRETAGASDEWAPEYYIIGWDKIVIFNVYEITSVTGTKVWDDQDNLDGSRPDSVTVNLLADGEKVDSQVVSADTDWKFSFTHLPAVKPYNPWIINNFVPITYTIEEEPVEGYDEPVVVCTDPDNPSTPTPGEPQNPGTPGGGNGGTSNTILVNYTGAAPSQSALPKTADESAALIPVAIVTAGIGASVCVAAVVSRRRRRE